jgi:hypothetical protein
VEGEQRRDEKLRTLQRGSELQINRKNTDGATPTGIIFGGGPDNGNADGRGLLEDEEPMTGTMSEAKAGRVAGDGQ